MIAVIALGFALAAGDGCTPGGEYRPVLCPTGLPRASSIVIEANGARTPGWTRDRQNCATFRPTVVQIGTYFRKARKTDAASADATIVNSPCHASGRVRFADGRTARWMIEKAGFGRLTFASGKEMPLYCPNCRRPFAI